MRSKMKGRIGVVVSTYNGSKYILEQLKSIVLQTHPVDKIYVFDDNSVDNTPLLVDGFLSKYSIPYVIKINKVNKGWKRNFFDALSFAQEDYIFLSDQDDIWFNNKVQEMVQIVESNSNINVLTSNYELLFTEESTTEKIAEEKRLVKDGKLVSVQLTPHNFYIRQPGCSFLVRKLFFDKYSYLWNEDMPHDSFLWKTALFTDSLFSINKPLFWWRRHSSNESNRAKITKEARIREVQSNLLYMKAASEVFSGTFFSEAYRYCELRSQLYKKNRGYLWIVLFLKYRQYYVSVRSCMGDLYLLIKNLNSL